MKALKRSTTEVFLEKSSVNDKEQAATLEKQPEGLKSPAKPGYTSLFECATSGDIVLIAVSSLFAIIAGALNPLLAVIFAQYADAFDQFVQGSIDAPEASSKSVGSTLYFIYFAIGQFVFTYLSTTGFYYTGDRLTRHLRHSYFKSNLRQNMAFFETSGAGKFTTQLTTDMEMIQEGLTGKLSICLTSAAVFGSAFVIAFILYWKLACIMLSTVVVMTACSAIGGRYAIRHTKASLSAASKGTTIAEEAISSIRHVTASGIQQQVLERFEPYLSTGRAEGMKARSAWAFVGAALNALPYMSYALSFWEGSRLLVDGSVSVTDVVAITLAIVIGAWSVGRVAPNAQGFLSCLASMSGIQEAIERKSPQDPLEPGGIDAKGITGDVTFENVFLTYPTRPDTTVLSGLSMSIPLHKTVAIVGASGSGKSSLVELLVRFYKPNSGQISIDGQDIQSFNLKSLRQKITFIGQETELFSTTIFENICFGLKSSVERPALEELKKKVVQAAKDANAHDFISALPMGYETQVGERGLQLSGGQRQRIAIARGLIGNPQILVLDEATSALDVHSELAVQKALEKTSRNRTTLIIAHRISTIRNADKIFVLSKGSVVEGGTHQQLINNRADYFRLTESQSLEAAYSEKLDLQPDEPDKPDEPAYLEPFSAQQGSGHNLEHLVANEKESDHQSQLTGDELSGTKTVDDESQPKPLSFLATQHFLASLNAPSLKVLLIGLVFAFASGLGPPSQSIMFAKLVEALSLPPSFFQTLRTRVDFWSLMYFVLALAILSAWMIQGVALGRVEENAIFRAKRQALQAILRQEVLFFDRRNHSAGHLISLVSSSTTDLAGVGGLVLGAVLSFCGTIGGGVVLSLAIGWKLALVCTATIPLVAGSGYVRMMMLSSFNQKIRTAQNETTRYASEAISVIRTVASLCLEERILAKFDCMLAEQSEKALRSILWTSIWYALSQSVPYLCAALAFWYGGTLIIGNEYTVFQFFVCFQALISGSQMAGIVFSYAPGFSKASIAAAELRSLFNLRPSIDTLGNPDARPIPSKRHDTAHIEFEKVGFCYPTRPDHAVLQNLSLSIPHGKFIALVGQSGSGKSTIIGLLERFFDPTEGCVKLNGQDITQLNVSQYRRRLALVGQETTLYSGTIRDNLTLGAATEDVEENAIITACKNANIHDFIISLPDGLLTEVGARGVMLSGGQRQRLAIARALLREAEILLLDEATSALDSESETTVQKALDKAVKRCTTIAVAHRLSTIQNADLICVFDHGVIVEQGTHQELLSKRGFYYEMVQTQSLV